MSQLTPARKPPRQSAVPIPPKEELEPLAQQMTYNQLAEHYGVERWRVNYWITKYDIRKKFKNRLILGVR